MKNKEALYKSVFLGPFTYLRPSVRTEAYIVLGLLLLQVLMLFVTKSFSSIIILVASLLASYAVDFINKEQNYKKVFVIISPRCKWPSIETRTSNSGNSCFTRSA